MRKMTEHDERPVCAARHSIFLSIVGKAQWILRARPDVLYAVKERSRCLSGPREIDFIAAKRLVKYLWHTRDLCMTISPRAGGPLTLESDSDSDWGGCLSTRCSTSGAMVWLCGGMVSAICRNQAVLAMSSPEAEYYAFSVAFAELR